MQEIEKRNEEKGNSIEKQSMLSKGNAMQEIVPKTQPSKPLLVPKDYRFAVSEKQFESVSQAHRDSINLLDSSGNALLGALESLVPPEGSMRTIGEYSGQNMRQLAKSICDIVQTKTGVVRSMYSISRDEF